MKVIEIIHSVTDFHMAGSPKMAFVFLLFLCCYSEKIQAAPLPIKIVDMTYVFDNTTLYYPQVRKFETETIVKGIVNNSYTSYWLFYEDYFSGTHVGTHMDAPAHFSKSGKTVDEIPVSNFFGPAAVIDITRKAEQNPDAEIEVSDLLTWERQTGMSLDSHIVLMRSGWGKRWGNRTAFLGTSTDDNTQIHSPGMSPEAAQWLVDNREVFGFGVDSVSLDKGQGSRDGFPTHQILLGAGLFGLENVAKMEEIPISGAQLTVLPMKIGGGSAAPTRIIASFPVVTRAPFFHRSDWNPYGQEDVHWNPFDYYK